MEFKWNSIQNSSAKHCKIRQPKMEKLHLIFDARSLTPYVGTHPTS